MRCSVEEWLEPFVEMQVPDSKPGPYVRIFDPVQASINQVLVVEVLKHGLDKVSKVRLDTLEP